MYRTILAAGLAFALGPAAAQAPRTMTPDQMRDCPGPRIHQADADTRPEARKLGDLPPGDLQLAVMREVAGCPDPVIIRYGYGIAPPDGDRTRTAPGR